MGKTRWSGQLGEDAAKLWEDGYSFGRIGSLLGMSRNAVAGRLCRMGLAGKSRTTYRYRQSRIAIQNSRAKKRASRRTMGIPARQPQGHLTPDPVVRPDWRGLNLVQLRNNTCRWPSRGPPYFFCGALGCDCKNKQPYCAYHDRIAHRYVREAA
jgi:GcrA cell cycle regulator